MRSRSLFLLPILLSVAPAVELAGQGYISPYDVFVFGDFTHINSETNGRIAIGGNADMTNWGVGQFLPVGYSDYSLVVRGNLTSLEGGVFQGRTYVGGTISAVNTGFPAQYPPESGTSPVSFDSEIARLTAISNGYAAMATNATTQYNGGQLQFLGGAGVNVFSVTIAMLQAATAGYAFVNPGGATNIVNVLGNSGTSAFNNDGFFFDCLDANDANSCQTGANESTPAAAARTVWNFNQQTTLSLDSPDHDTPVHGSLFAPNAFVTFGYGDVVGNVVVGSATSHAEYYANHDFVGELPPPSETPEPATLGLVATGFIGLAGAARLRKRHAHSSRQR
ncbi:MAG: choice-of-anchor A family protein [Gemmatimonadota bacterium]